MKGLRLSAALALLVMVGISMLPTFRAVASQEVTSANLDQMIASAKTPADHEAIAVFYDGEAADAKKNAELHRNTADTYRKLKISKPVYMAEMCDTIAAGFQKTATDAENLAKAHREMAKSAATQTGQ
ncbi:MAG TPA: hypothetical protein VIX12_06645 [Candidatus Binataceae bacterium]